MKQCITLRRVARLLVAALPPAIVLAACGAATSAGPSGTAAPAVVAPASATAPVSPPPQPSAASANQSLFFIDAQHGWLARGAVLATSDGGATWRELYHSDLALSAIQFIDNQHGWLAGCADYHGFGTCDGRVLATNDGGATWSQVWSGDGTSVEGLAFVGADDGWLLTDRCTAGFGCAQPVLLATKDGARSWQALPLPPSNAARQDALGRFDADHGWVATANNLFVTSDGGGRWTRDENPCARVQPEYGSGFDLIGTVSFADAGHGWIGCTGNGGGGMAPKTLYATADGGRTWQLLGISRLNGTPSPGGAADLSWSGAFVGLQFIGRSQGWILVDGPAGSVYHTGDGGRTWAREDDTTTGGGLEHLLLTDATHGWVWGSGQFLRTVDGGADWEPVEGPAPG